MRVQYRAVRGARQSSFTTYEQTGVKFCCEAMERQWGRLVGFGVRDCKRSTSADVNLFSDRAQAHGKTVLEVTALGFCPWCGEAAEPIRVK